MGSDVRVINFVIPDCNKDDGFIKCRWCGKREIEFGYSMDDLDLDNQTAVVTLTHDPKLDDPALKAALTSPAFYVGALGSKKTQAKRAERLAELGLDKAALEKIHGPVGLDIGAVSPGEIAVAIMAEIINEMRGD